VGPFENVGVYPLVAKLLGLEVSHLKIGAIDGDLRMLQMILKETRGRFEKSGSLASELARRLNGRALTTK
jgi:hypothetical protein